MHQNLDSLYPSIPFDPDMVEETKQWLIEDFWLKGKINAVAGFEKSGKSRLVNWLLVGMGQGYNLGLRGGGYQTRILYLCGEETVATVNNRVRDYAVIQGVPFDGIQIEFIEAAAMRLDLKPQRDWLKEKLLDESFTMLVADPLRRLHAADEDKSTQMAPILNDLRSLSNRHNISILLIHHTAKINDETDMERMANWFRGSTDVAAILDTGQYVDRLTKTRVQVMRHGRFAPLPPIELEDKGTKEKDSGFVRVK